MLRLRSCLILRQGSEGEQAKRPARRRARRSRPFNQTIAKLDDGGKTVKYLDIGDKFLQPDGSLTKDIMPDYLHLSPRGYEIWAEAITPTLKEMLR